MIYIRDFKTLSNFIKQASIDDEWKNEYLNIKPNVLLVLIEKIEELEEKIK
jgi:hypothetical protein